MAALCPSARYLASDPPPSTGGRCYFRILSATTAAASCGCRTFWLDRAKAQAAAGGDRGEAWCYCGHHACFHDPATNDKAVLAPAAPVEGLGVDHGQCSDVGVQASMGNALYRGQRHVEHAHGSALPSTAPTSVAKTRRASRPDVFMPSGDHQAPQRRPLVSAPRGDTRFHDVVLSPTEVNTPSLMDISLVGGPTIASQRLQWERFTVPDAPGQDHGDGIANSGSSKQPDERAPFVDTCQSTLLSELRNMIKSYALRLDVLESLSFSHVPAEEVQEKFELVDGRLLDLEGWREDRDSRANGPCKDDLTDQKRRRAQSKEMSTSFTSTSSLGIPSPGSRSDKSSSSTALSTTAAVHAQYSSHLNGIERRLDTLEDRISSPACPWNVEVVLLPWGRDLRGIWASVGDAEAPTVSSNHQEWNGLTSPAGNIFSTMSSANKGWTSESIMAWADAAGDWMVPRACGPNSAVYKRLESSGLIQNVTLTSQDTRSVLAACRKAFSQFLNSTAVDGFVSNEVKARFQGLCEPLVPLRKIRGSSSLRFLDPSEMITSAVWTPAFLDATVFMKAKGAQRRLYLTTPDAYTQPKGVGWTWQQLKNQARALPDMIINSEVCWAYHHNLDVISGTASVSETVREILPPCASDCRAPSGPRMASPAAHPTILRTSPLPEMRALASPRQQMAFSIAPAEQMPMTSVQLTKRQATTPEDHLRHKRRRQSVQIRAELGLIATPRWSHEPPSPHVVDGRSSTNSDAQAAATWRGGTPFAYATPHSNTITTVHIASGDGDTEADTEVIQPSSEQGEEEWEGVGEQTLPVDSGEQEQSFSMDSEVFGCNENEDEYDEGITIYEKRDWDVVHE